MRLLLAIYILMVASDSAFAAESECGPYLDSSSYRQGQHLTFDPAMVAMSRKPEPGSLEDRHPGVGKEIIRIMYGELSYFKWTHISPMQKSDAIKLYDKLSAVEDSIRAIPKKFSLSEEDAERFRIMSDYVTKIHKEESKNVSSFTRTSEHLEVIESMTVNIQAALMELVASVLLDGKKFLFHVHVTDHYLGFKPNGRRILHLHHTNNREIDLIIQRRDGTDLWVEAKNNAISWTIEEFNAWCKENNCAPETDIKSIEEEFWKRRYKYFSIKGIDQAKRQVAARKFVGQEDKVKILLISKYGIPEDYRNELKALGIETWPLFIDTKPFQDELFRHLVPLKDSK